MDFFSISHLSFLYPNWNFYYLVRGPIFLLRNRSFNLYNAKNPGEFEKLYGEAWSNYLAIEKEENVFPSINHILHSNWMLDIFDFPVERNVDYVVSKYTPPTYFDFDSRWRPPETYNFRKWMCLNYFRMYYTGEEYIAY